MISTMHPMNQLIAAAIAEQGRGTSARLARELEVTPQTVSKWKDGQVQPERDKWPRIEDVLRLEPGALLEAYRESIMQPAAGAVPGTPDTVLALLDQMGDKMQRIEDRVQALEQSADPPPHPSESTSPPAPGGRRAKSASRTS